MQVMQSSEFEKTEVLVGQTSATQNFGVSDDPMLMSMLSTGFYGNPLRTMIQEIMFNAWDAHRMGDCLDKPIDIYINEGTGLIIRDYGPGIPDEDIHAVYCIYGGSTKRQDKRQTGGFGLGSKSPFSYSESFTVTSMNQHRKCMYLISRVSEDGGKPGRTRLLDVATTETGLMVTVPIEEKDRRTALKYVRDVLFLSGIKANLHYMDDAPELIESLALKTGEYHIDDRADGHKQSGIYAVYGGVRYSIPDHEDYQHELTFLKHISQQIGLFIGFAADTLTPLPNREGLNMSLKCRENVRTGLELCIERFKEILTPLVHAFFRECFEAMVANEIQPQFAIYNAAAGRELPISMVDFQKKYLHLTPMNVDVSMWKVGLRMIKDYRPTLIRVFGEDRWLNILVQQFCIAYPDNKSLGFAVAKLTKGLSRPTLNETICNNILPPFFKDLYEVETQLKAAYPDDDTLRATFRYQTGTSVFTKLSRIKTRVSHVSDKHKKSVAQFEDPYSLYDVKNLKEVEQVFLTKTIILGKTNQCLVETVVPSTEYFSKKYVNQYDYAYHTGDQTSMMYCVVYNRKGAYQKAKEIFEAKGYKVIEAAEPAKIIRTKVEGEPVKSVPTYPILKWCSSNQWREYGENTEIEDPTHMLYILQSLVQDDAYCSRSRKPSRELINLVTFYYPKTVLIQNITQAKLLNEKGVDTFGNALKTIFENFQTKKYRFRNIARAIKIKGKSNISFEMLKDPTIQKTMGMVPIEPEDEATFWQEVSTYESITQTEYHEVIATNKAAQLLIQTTFDADPMKAKVEAAIDASSFFGESALRNKWFSLPPEQKPDFAKRVSKFILGN